MSNISDNNYSFESKIALKELRLWEENLRYIDEEYDLNNLGANNYNYEEIKIMKKLISYEEDLNELRALIVSLALGFKPFEDPIFVKKGKDEKFYVVEGNRRVMSLKLLTIYNDFFSKEMENNFLFGDLIKNNKNNKAYLDEEIKENMEKNVITNYNIIRNTIQSFKQNYIEHFSYVLVSERVSNEDIWILINGRQSAEKTGKRIFGRLHQFYLILNKFNIFLSEFDRDDEGFKKTLEKLSKHFGRNITRATITAAVWCKALVEIYNEKYPNKKINKLMFAPSAIELARNTVSFKNEENENKSISQNIDLKYELLEINDFDKLKFSISKEKFEVLSLWLVEKFISGELSTRGLKDKSESEQIRSILVFDNKQIKSLKQQIKEIKLKEEKKIEINELEKELKTYDFMGNTIKKQANKNIKDNYNMKLINKFQKTLYYIWTFDVPSSFESELYKENSLPFISLSASIRSTYDLLIFLALDISDELLHIVWEFYNKIYYRSKKSYLISSTGSKSKFDKKKEILMQNFTRNGFNELISNYNTKAVDDLRYLLRNEDNFINKDLVEAIVKCQKSQKWFKENEIEYNIINNIELIFSFWKSSKKLDKSLSDRDVLNKIIHSSYIINDNHYQIKIFNSLNKQYKFLFKLLIDLRII